jgi:hypothetical protein
METTNVMKSILTILISFGLAFSVFGQTRNVVVGTNGAIVQPTNFWSADVTNARSGLGLGSASTNPASAFQPSSSVLSNLALNGGGTLTNINASNVVGSLAIVNGGTGATNASGARQNLGSTTVGDAVFIATNALSARSAIGATTVGNNIFTLTNPDSVKFLRINADNTVSAISSNDFRAAIGLGSASTNPFSAFQPSSAVLSNLANSNGVDLTNITISNLIGVLTTNGNGAGLTNLTAANITGTVGLASNITGTIAISNGGTGATNAAIARTNLGLGWSVLTNTNFASALLGTKTSESGETPTYYTTVEVINYTNALVFTNSQILFGGMSSTTNTAPPFGVDVDFYGNVSLNPFNVGGGESSPSFTINSADGRVVIVSGDSLSFSNGSDAETRTNLGLGYLGTNAEITRTNLGLGYLGTNAEITRTNIGLKAFKNPDDYAELLDANGSTILDVEDGVSVYRAIIWQGTNNEQYKGDTRTNLGLGWSALTNSNAGIGLVSVNTNGQVVSPTNFWQVAPIQTLVQSIIPVTNSTNAATNARNLYVYSLATNVINVTNTITLPTNSSTFNGDTVTITHDGTTSSVTAIRQLGSATNFTTISNFAESVKFIRESDQWGFYHNISYVEPIRFTDGAIEENKAVSRTNLGLGWTALTNTSATNFQKAIFYTNTAPSNIGGNLGSIAAWIEIVASNGVTYKVPAYTNIP